MTIPDNMARLAATANNLLSRYVTRYQEKHSLDDAAFCERAGFAPSKLNNLKLCRPPRRGTPLIFQADVETIAAHVGANPDKLFEVLSDESFIPDPTAPKEIHE